MYYLFVYNLSPDAPFDADEEIKELVMFNNMSDAVDYGAASRLMFDVIFENRLIFSNAVNKRRGNFKCLTKIILFYLQLLMQLKKA